MIVHFVSEDSMMQRTSASKQGISQATENKTLLTIQETVHAAHDKTGQAKYQLETNKKGTCNKVMLIKLFTSCPAYGLPLTC